MLNMTNDREKISKLFEDILSTPTEEQIILEEHRHEKKADGIYHRILLSYHKHNFQSIIKEENGKFIVTSIIVYRKFATSFKPAEGMVQMPIISPESIRLVSLQSIENFEFDLQIFKAVCEKMLHTEINFVELTSENRLDTYW